MRFKFLVCFTLISSLFAVCCGGVSAVCTRVNLNQPVFSIRSDKIASIGILKSSMLDDETRNFLRDWKSGSANFFVSTDQYNVYFFKFIPTVSGKGVSVGTSFTYGEVRFKSGRMTSVAFSCLTGEPVKQDIRRQPTENYLFTDDIPNYGSGNMFDVPLFNFIQYKNLSAYGGSKEKSFFQIWYPIFDSPTDEFEVVFDDNLKDEPEPPTSSEPESSEPPLSSQPELPQPPPVNEDYLGITPTAVKNVFAYLTQTIGTAVNSGWVIFFYLAGIVVIIKLIRYFLGE